MQYAGFRRPDLQRGQTLRQLRLLRNNHTGEIIAPAPIFDNGLSLFNYAMPDDFKNLSAYAKTRSNPYRISYEDVCKEVMGAKQKAQLRRMVDFKFTRHPSLNLPEERLQPSKSSWSSAQESCSPFRFREVQSAKMSRKDDPSAVWEHPHTADTYWELDGRKSRNIVV